MGGTGWEQVSLSVGENCGERGSMKDCHAQKILAFGVFAHNNRGISVQFLRRTGTC